MGAVGRGKNLAGALEHRPLVEHEINQRQLYGLDRIFGAAVPVSVIFAIAGSISAVRSVKGEEQTPLDVRVDWADFLARQDLVIEAPGNKLLRRSVCRQWAVGGDALAGGRRPGPSGDRPHRCHRPSHGTGQFGSDPRKGRLPIGHFTFATKGKITGGTMRVRLYDAEAVGKISTEKGEVEWRLLAHTRLPLIVMEVAAKGGEAVRWEWKPDVSVVPRKPSKDRTNPPPTIAEKDGMHLCVQKRSCDGSDYCTAWQEVPAGGNTRRLLATVADDWPKPGSDATAAAAIVEGRTADFAQLLAEHRAWWHAYYPASFLSIPDARMEAFYWIQMYKFGSSIRKGRPLCDVIGPWYKPTVWPAIWFNLNAQMLFWTFPCANRLEMMENLSDALEKNKAALIDAVPEQYRYDSAGISRCTGTDFVERLERWHENGNLTWLCHNLWLQYRYSMDDAFLRQRVYPLLRRAVNLYLHIMTKDCAGPLPHAQGGVPRVLNLPRQQLRSLLRSLGLRNAARDLHRLKIEDELIPKWKDVLENLIEFPTDKNGYCTAPGSPAAGHRHWSHLLMFYPYYTINWDQPEHRELLERSWRYWADAKMPNAWSQAVMSSMASSMGHAEDALKHLQASLDCPTIAANTMHTEGGNPCFETPSGMCQMLLDMLLQSWGERIRVFPAVPAEWPNVVFHNLRTEGAFLVSAERKDGKTSWVRIKSLAGEPCRIKPGFDAGEVTLLVGGRPATLDLLGDGVYGISLAKGDTALLFTGNRPPAVIVKPLPRRAEERNPYEPKVRD